MKIVQISATSSPPTEGALGDELSPGYTEIFILTDSGEIFGNCTAFGREWEGWLKLDLPDEISKTDKDL